MSKFVDESRRAMARSLLHALNSWVDCACLPGLLEWRACA